MRTALAWGGLAALVLGIALASLGAGRYAVPPGDVLAVLAGHAASEIHRTVVLELRLPRVLMAALAGAALALAGAALQGVFRNPLVGPQVVGVSSGAAFGGALALSLALGPAWLAVLAFAGAALALLVVILLSRWGGPDQLLMLVLAGVVTSAVFGALTSLLVFLADPEARLPGIVFWLMGSFAFASWPKLALLGAIVVPAASLLLLLRWRLDLLSLGEEDARALGVPVGVLRLAVLGGVCLIAAAQVSVSGVVGWVGLVVPHLARMVVGPGHPRMLPAAAGLGAGFLMASDTLARSLTGAEVPLGILTALVGAPAFGVLLVRARGARWGRA